MSSILNFIYKNQNLKIKIRDKKKFFLYTDSKLVRSSGELKKDLIDYTNYVLKN